LLNERGVTYVYREMTAEPLTVTELRALFRRLDRTPREALRVRDAARAGVGRDETDAELLGLMATHPTLLQRPILDDGRRAVIGRPLENLEALLPSA